MKIIQRVGIMNRGGQETLWMNVLRSCKKEDFEMDFLVKDSNKGAYDDEIKALGSSVFCQNRIKAKSTLFGFIERIGIIENFFKEHPGYQVIHINTYLAIDALIDVLGAQRAKVPCIVVHSHNSDGPHRFVQFVCSKILNLLKVKRIACSQKAAVWMYGTTKNIPIINNGIIVDDFVIVKEVRDRVRKELQITNKDILIGHVGRFNEQKNHSFLIDIFKEIHNQDKNFKLLLVGEGPLKKQTQDKVKNLGLEDGTIFFGSSDKVNELMMAMDVFLFPSLYEGLPLVMVEAQSSGLKCICSDTISDDTFITDLVKPISLRDDASKWAKAVINECNYARQDYSKRIKEKGFDILTTIDQLKQLYNG